MVNRYLLACILSTCYFSSEVAASNAAAKRAKLEALRRQQQQAAAAAASAVNVDKQLANEGRALQGLGTLFGANDPNATAPNILSDGMKGEIDQVRALQGLGTLFGADPNTTAPNILSDGMKGEIDQVRALQGLGTLFGADPNTTAPGILSDGMKGEIDQVRALQGLGTLFGADPNTTAPGILSDGMKGEIDQVRALHGVGDLVSVVDFDKEPYKTALHADARAQLGRVHALHEVDDLATVDDNALNDGEDNEFTTVLDDGLRHQMKGLQMVLKPSSIPDDLYQGQDGMAAGFGTALRNFLTIATAQDIKDNRDDAQQRVNELIDAIKVAAIGARHKGAHLGAWQKPIRTLYDNSAPTRADYLGLIRGMANGIKNTNTFDRVYLFGPLKAIIRDMLIHFPQ